MLHMAWNLGMIARPSAYSTAAPCTFMATSQVLPPYPNTNSPAATGGTPPVAIPAAEISDITATVRDSPSREMTSPDRGVATVEPAAMHSRTSPSTPGVTRSASRTAGIRAAQLAKAKPAQKKTA